MIDRAFINTCVRLDNAVKILKAFATQRIYTNLKPADDMPRDVSKMASKVFQGLRAVYAVSHPCNHGIAVLPIQADLIYFQSSAIGLFRFAGLFVTIPTCIKKIL